MRPWQRPPQLQHGLHDNIFGDAEATGALLARLTAARDRVRRLGTDPSGQRSRTGSRAGAPSEVYGRGDAAEAYLALLDDILEDRIVTSAEVDRLRAFSTECGIGALEAASLDRQYLDRAWQRARADATVTPAVVRDIKRLADLLGVPMAVPRNHRRSERRQRWVAVSVETDMADADPSSASAAVPMRPEPERSTSS